ncbi:dimethyl sulfoxide reductase anchor subunit family protein [Slackia exigua]|uniref:dimethyl sulfoxide reductase anchor subunit family protein n=1 Tax=Slackia exigua TaxID=84109 RepID=UPI00210D77E7|nr:dimethyl sulfoxide reductase anchor subunit [Slackia exigua]
MNGGFNGQTLAVFTAFAPAGAVAFLCLATFLLVRRPALDGGQFDRLGKWLFVPIAVVWAGFIASATHLGMPSNALYVVFGIGRSPLSNEVAAVIAFLFFSGVFWLYMYRIGHAHALSLVLLAAAMASAVLMLACMALAYGVDTVVSWHTWHTPANLLATAAFSGPALASAVLLVAEVDSRMWPRVLIAISAVALVAGTALLLSYLTFLSEARNNVIGALSLVGDLPLIIAVHAVVGGVGLCLQTAGLSLKVSRARAIVFSLVGWLLVIAASLIVRFPFYDAYLSVGF